MQQIRLPYEKAQEIGLFCYEELGLKLRYRLLERRIATRYSPAQLKAVFMDDLDFLSLPIQSGSYSNSGVWAYMSESDYVLFKLKFYGHLDYTELAN